MTPSRISLLSAVGVLALGAGVVRAEGGLSGALVGYTGGYQLDRRPIVRASQYSASPYYSGSYGSLAPPIFMTTLNTPGIYGAYSFGVAPLTFNREPLFYPSYNPREVIPSISVTMPPVRDYTTAAGVATLYGAPPSVTPAIPGTTALSTYPDQRPVVPALGGAVPGGENVARLVVRVPDDARLEFEGVPTAQTGRLRKFTTPPLAPGQKYRYDVRAAWMENGREVVQDRQVVVYAGERADVDFLRPADQAERELRSGPPLRVPPTEYSTDVPANPRNGVVPAPPGADAPPPAAQTPPVPPATPRVDQPLRPTLPPRRP